LNPKHTALFVAETLLQGLENGTLILESSLEASAQLNIDRKSHLVKEITVQGGIGKDFSGVDLSEVNLSGTDLSEAVFTRANLSGTNLNRANLSKTYLSKANLSKTSLRKANFESAYLSGTDLSEANLSGADFRKANLRGANLDRANVVKTLFGDNLGLTRQAKDDLMSRGAIFQDSPEAPVETYVNH